MDNYNKNTTLNNSYPKSDSDFLDLEKIIDNYIIDKNIRPFFNQNSKFLTLGSCFAGNLHKFLLKNSFDSYHEEFTEALNNPLILNNFLIQLKSNPAGKEAFIERIKESNVFILTVGMALAWFRLDGSLISNPFNKKNINDYMQKTISVEMAKLCLLRVYQSIYELNKDIKIVVTLSPVATNRTFEYHSAIFADCLSKSILRSAIHESLLQVPENLKPIYFPSFEIVKWIGAHRGDAYGNTSGKAEGNPPRDVSPHYINAIIKSFIKHYQI